MSNIAARPAPPVRAYTPGPPDPVLNDFLSEQVSKQQKNNFHSSSLTSGSITMAANTVNKTALHPGGVAYVSCHVAIGHLTTGWLTRT